MAGEVEAHLPREGDWALVKIIGRDEYEASRSAKRSDISFFVDATRGEVFCKVLEWSNPKARAKKPGYEDWAIEHGFELIKDPNKVCLLRQQIAGKMSLAAIS